MIDGTAHAAARASRPRPEAIIHQLALQQHGLVTRRQLQSAGVSTDLVDHRVKAGSLRPAHAGVYMVGPVVAPRAREMAAVLACADSAVSHESAATLLELGRPQDEGDVVHVTVPTHRRCGRRAGIRTHRSQLASDEITRIDGIPVTTAARTLIDLGSVVAPRDIELAVARAERLELLRLPDLATLLARHRNRPGTRFLRRIVAAAVSPPFTRSEAEERLLALIRDSGLPLPETNVRVAGLEVDFFWRRARFVVEVDGFAYHRSTRAFLHDCQRDASLAAAGVQVLRLSWHQIVRDDRKTLVQLAQALARASP